MTKLRCPPHFCKAAVDTKLNAQTAGSTWQMCPRCQGGGESSLDPKDTLDVSDGTFTMLCGVCNKRWTNHWLACRLVAVSDPEQS